jgi:hypothetical protein
MSADGYISTAGHNYGLINGATPAEARWIAMNIGNATTSQVYNCAGLASPNPDFPTAANTFTGDTTDGVTGTGTAPAAADLRKGVQCGVGGTGTTGTLQSTGNLGGNVIRRDANG